MPGRVRFPLDLFFLAIRFPPSGYVQPNIGKSTESESSPELIPRAHFLGESPFDRIDAERSSRVRVHPRSPDHVSHRENEIGISFFPGMAGRRGESLGTYPDVVFRGLDHPPRHATPPAAASDGHGWPSAAGAKDGGAAGSLSPSVYPPWEGNQLETRT